MAATSASWMQEALAKTGRNMPKSQRHNAQVSSSPDERMAISTFWVILLSHHRENHEPIQNHWSSFHSGDPRWSMTPFKEGRSGSLPPGWL